MRFMATASVVCASVEIEPSDIAPVEKRLPISPASSSSSSGTEFPNRNSNSPRNVLWRFDWSLMSAAYSLYVAYLFSRVACCSLAIASGVQVWSSPRTRQAYSPPASSMLRSTGSTGSKASAWMRIASSATSNSPMPSTLDAVPVKYLSTSERASPTASKSCEPVYDMYVDTPILDITFFSPLPSALVLFLIALEVAHLSCLCQPSVYSRASVGGTD